MDISGIKVYWKNVHEESMILKKVNTQTCLLSLLFLQVFLISVNALARILVIETKLLFKLLNILFYKFLDEMQIC